MLIINTFRTIVNLFLILVNLCLNQTFSVEPDVTIYTFVTLFSLFVTSLTQNLIVFSDNFCYSISEKKEYQESP